MKNIKFIESFELLSMLDKCETRTEVVYQLNLSRQSLYNKIKKLESVFKIPILKDDKNNLVLTTEARRVLGELERINITMLSLVPSEKGTTVDISIMYDKYIKNKFQNLNYDYTTNIIKNFNDGTINNVIASDLLIDSLNYDEINLFKLYPIYSLGSQSASVVIRSSDVCLFRYLEKKGIKVEIFDGPIDDLILNIINKKMCLYTLFPEAFDILDITPTKLDISPMRFLNYTREM